MKKFLILINLFLFNISNAEIINKVIIEGNDRISNETVMVYGDISLNVDYDQFKIDKILKNLYETNFFENIEIKADKKILLIKLIEYEVINDIQIEGEKAKKIREAILEQMQLKTKDSFIKSKLKEDLNLIKKLYASLGYNFTDVDAKVEKFSEKRLNLVIFVDRGKRSKISTISFIGDKRIKDSRLRDIIVSEEHKFWKFLSKNTSLNQANIELDKRLIENYYKSIGFYDVQVLSSNAEVNNTQDTTLTYNINAGNRYRITKISTNLSPVLDKKIFSPLVKKYKKIIGKYYSPFLIKKLLDEVDLLIASNDLQFIEHTVNEIIENKDIEIKINIFEGSKKLVEKINIKGNYVTEESVIRSELLLDEGDPLNNLKLDQSIAKLKARNIFGNVTKEIKPGSTKDVKVIDIEVEEKPTGEISAGAGIGTNGGSFAFDVKENNWIGTGIKVGTFINVDKSTLKGGIEVTNPNYNFSGNQLNFNLSSTQNDNASSGYENSIIAAGIGTKFEQFKDIYLSPRLNLKYDDLTVTSKSNSNIKKQAGTFTDLTFDYGLLLDQRDRAFKPTNGYVTGFNQTLPVYADAPYTRNSYFFSQYKSFGEDVLGAVKFYVVGVNGLSDDDVRLSNRIKVSSKKLRGFEQGKIGPKDGKDFIGGNYASVMNFETTLPNLLPESTKIDVGAFLDIGNVWGVDYSNDINDTNKIRSTAGATASWTSPVGPMSFVLSQNITKAATDVTESFNFSLGTSF